MDYQNHMEQATDDTWDSQKHNQGLWIHGVPQGDLIEIQGRTFQPMCGTSCCLAGKAVILNGDTLVNYSLGGKYTGGAVSLVVTDDGNIVSVSDRARELFGITQGEAALMFNGENQVYHLIAQGTKIAAKYGHTLEVI